MKFSSGKNNIKKAGKVQPISDKSSSNQVDINGVHNTPSQLHSSHIDEAEKNSEIANEVVVFGDEPDISLDKQLLIKDGVEDDANEKKSESSYSESSPRSDD